MYINFKTLPKVGFLMLFFFLMDHLSSVRLKPLEKESIRPVAQLDDLILIERWQLIVAMQLWSVEPIRMRSQKNPE